MILKTILSLVLLCALNNGFNSYAEINFPNKKIDTDLNKRIVDFEFPIFSNAYDIHKNLGKPAETKSISYKVKINYPSKDIFYFYDKKFRAIDLLPFYEDNYGDRKWSNFIDGTKPGNPEIDQLIATWIDKERQIRIVLGLIYESSKNKSSKDEVFVVCQIQPFFLLP